MNPLVSIVIPIYNSEKYLGECVESVVGQTYRDWELLLIDDGSTDGSSEIAKQWGLEDRRIRYIRKENAGVSSARNCGIDNATGEYLMFVDSDDLCSPRLVECLVNGMDEFSDVVACGIQRFVDYPIEQEGRIQKINLENISAIYCEYDVNAVLHAPVAKLFKREKIQRNQIKYDEGLSLGEDLCFNLDYLDFVEKGAMLTGALYYYRDSQSSLSKNIRGDYADIQMKLFDRKYDFVETHNIRYDFSSHAAGILKDMVLSLCRSNAPSLQKKESLARIRKHPLMRLSRKATLSDQLLLTAIRLLPPELLIKLLR